MAPNPSDDYQFEGFGGSAVAPSSDNDSLQKLSDEEDSDDPFKTWIYAPLIIFLAIALAIVAIQFRRRRRKVVNNLMLRQALARDIEALGSDSNDPNGRRIYIIRTGPDGHPAELLPTGGRRARAGGLGLRPSRWQWSLPTMGSRRAQEEGLNELGEAPPPYDATKNPEVPLEEIRRTSETLSRISEEEPREAALGQGHDTPRRTESRGTSASNTNANADAIAPENTTAVSVNTPDDGETRNNSSGQPTAPPPAYMR